MTRTGITTERAEFLLVSFEGSDRYSLGGGLGVRVALLSEDPPLIDLASSLAGSDNLHLIRRFARWPQR